MEGHYHITEWDGTKAVVHIKPVECYVSLHDKYTLKLHIMTYSDGEQHVVRECYIKDELKAVPLAQHEYQPAPVQCWSPKL
jgi:hypothetical protein